MLEKCGRVDLTVFASRMSNRQLWQLKKSKSWGLLWSYQLNSIANSAHLGHFEVNGLDWHCCLAGSSETAPKSILIFSIARGADYSYEVKNSEIWAPAFFKHNNSFIATVICHHPSSRVGNYFSSLFC